MSSYLQLKKRAFMSIVNGVKGFVRTVQGVPPISLEDCVDSDSLIDWKLYGNSAQDGTPTPETPIPVVSVGEYDTETGKYKIPVTARGESSSITTYIYLDEPLRKVGDYADYVDFGKGEVVRNVSETVFNGSETWTKTSDVLSETYQGFAVSNSVYNIPNDKLVCMSDKFPYSSVSIKNSVRIASGLWGLRIIIGSEYVPDLEGATFKNWLSENNVKIVYPTATSTEENISLPKLPTIKGTTIYEIGTSLNASNMEATYYSSIKGE